jgi:Helix-turn-helix domain
MIQKKVHTMTEVTYDSLPKAVTQIFAKLEAIEKLLLSKSNEDQTSVDRWFDLLELCDYLPDKPAKATIYGWIHNSSIPHHKGKKKLRFLKSEIDQWLMQGRKKTLRETADEAEQYITRRAKK